MFTNVTQTSEGLITAGIETAYVKIDSLNPSYALKCINKEDFEVKRHLCLAVVQCDRNRMFPILRKTLASG